VLCGPQRGSTFVLKTLLDPGNEVIFFSPYFVEYHFYVDYHGGVATVVPTDAHFDLNLEALESALTPRSKVVLINSPNNPTGVIYRPPRSSNWASCSNARSASLTPGSIC